MWERDSQERNGQPDQQQPGRLLTCIWQESPLKPDMQAYARQFTHLLGGRLLTQPVAGSPDPAGSMGDCDLIFAPGAAEPLQHHEGHASLLAVRRPSWPLCRILLLIRGEATDAVTVDWGLRLAQASGSAVTVLAVLPPHPSGSPRLARATGNFLAGHSLPGRQVRRMLEQFADAGVEATLKLNQGTPERQVRQTVIGCQHDLIVVGAEPQGRLLDRVLEPLIPVLLQCTTEPILLARQRLTRQQLACQQTDTAGNLSTAERRNERCNPTSP